jgi:predicted RNA-binding protein
MCDINAFMKIDGSEEKIMENVDRVETRSDGMFLANIFGEEKTVQARIVFFDNGQKKMILEPV